ncbi:MAG: epoxyqueuosine reductase QueH [Lachnospiraceae bacterium]|nr:epoxyqueuosine reductase QueH [Lachnospiraceae bacterium]
MQQRINYQRRMEEELARFSDSERLPRLFLHSCCAPCSSYVLELLSRYFRITLFYYNPNISPKEEFEKRTAELARLLREMPLAHPAELLVGDYRPEAFYGAVRGLEQEPEGGARCEVCYRLRLREAFREAKERGFDYVTTTLSISPLKSAEKLNAIGKELSEEYGIPYLYSDFKKKGGYQRSVELSREYGLYRQNFCGCVFSKEEAARREAERAAGRSPEA